MFKLKSGNIFILLMSFLLISFVLHSSGERVEVFDFTRNWKYVMEKEVLTQYHPDKTKQYQLCPPLHPDRFRRRIKMVMGIDVTDYPQDASLLIQTFGRPYLINLNTQLLSVYNPWIDFPEEVSESENPYADWESEQGPDEITIPPAPDEIYATLRRFIFYKDFICMNTLVNYRTEKMDFYKKDPANEDALSIYGPSMERGLDFIYGFYDISPFVSDREIVSYLAVTKIQNVINYPLLNIDKRDSDTRLDMIWLYALETDDTKFESVSLGIPLTIETLSRLGTAKSKLQKILSSVTEGNPNPWGEKYNANRAGASFLNFILRFENKSFEKFVIQFMSGQADSYMRDVFGKGLIDCKSVREDIRKNNYYGYSLLREFCENSMREMPTLEKIGSSFTGTVKEREELLLLEPFKESYDIDTVYMGEHFIAYEMGHDDYYFIEIEKPVESPVAGPDGYAMILDRTEKVYGYLPKMVVKELNQDTLLQEEVYRDIRSAQYGVINDPDGYVNIRQEGNSQSKIVGTIKDGEIFNYWKTPSNWYIVETRAGMRGFVYKDRIKKYESKDNWIIDE